MALFPLLALGIKKSLFSSDLRKPLRASNVWVEDQCEGKAATAVRGLL